jgi:hypothetical protein
MRAISLALVALGLTAACKSPDKAGRAKVTMASAGPSPSGFPGAAPDSAKELACGGRWQLVRQGKTPGPQAPRQMVASIKVWDTAGKQVFTSAANPNGMVVGLDVLPPAIREMIRMTGMGGVARAWLPPAAMEGWKPHAFPGGELLYEIEILGDLPPPTNEVQELPGEASPVIASALAAAASAPDLSGPPQDAHATASGLKFVVMSGGGATHPGPEAKVNLFADAWVTSGLTVEQVVRRHSVTVKAQAAPAGLGDVLKELGPGGRARVWVPAGKSASIFPQQKGQPLIVDLTLASIEGG